MGHDKKTKIPIITKKCIYIYIKEKYEKMQKDVSLHFS